jgi:hypothetical protein
MASSDPSHSGSVSPSNQIAKAAAARCGSGPTGQITYSRDHRCHVSRLMGRKQTAFSNGT